MLGVSKFVSQKIPKSYGVLRALRVEIWPPHPDRPTEIYYIWRHIRKLRKELREASRISRLVISFTENKLAKWSRDGEPRRTLREFDDYSRDDMQRIFDEFDRTDNIAEIRMRLPPSLRRNEEVRLYFSGATPSINGYSRLAQERESSSHSQDPDPDTPFSEGTKRWLKHATAKTARAKLDAITDHRNNKMSHADYLEFTKV